MAAAPFVQVGVVNVMSAGGVPPPVAGAAAVNDESLPAVSNCSVPDPMENGVPAVPPVISAPGTVMP